MIFELISGVIGIACFKLIEHLIELDKKYNEQFNIRK